MVNYCSFQTSYTEVELPFTKKTLKKLLTDDDLIIICGLETSKTV